MDTIKKLSSYLGLHPLVGGSMIVFDWMLFSGEAASFGAAWPLSVLAGLFLFVPCLLIQRYAYGDDWAAATGKSLLVGLITAVPTALPSIGTGILTVLGLPGLTNEEQSGPDEHR